MLNVSVLVPGEKTPRFASFRLDLSRLYKLYKRYKLYSCLAPGLLAIDHFGVGLREQVHIAGPARRHVIAVADDPRGARVGAGVTEQAAGFAEVVGRVLRHVDEIILGRQRTRHLGLHAAIAGRFAFLLQIRAVVAGVPEAAGEFHQPPRLALHRPGQRHRLAAVQRRLAAGFGPAARRQHHAVADRADRLAQVETAREEALQPGVFQIRPHAARPVPARQDQAVDGAGV